MLAIAIAPAIVVAPAMVVAPATVAVAAFAAFPAVLVARFVLHVQIVGCGVNTKIKKSWLSNVCHVQNFQLPCAA